MRRALGSTVAADGDAGPLPPGQPHVRPAGVRVRDRRRRDGRRGRDDRRGDALPAVRQGGRGRAARPACSRSARSRWRGSTTTRASRSTAASSSTWRAGGERAGERLRALRRAGRRDAARDRQPSRAEHPRLPHRNARLLPGHGAGGARPRARAVAAHDPRPRRPDDRAARRRPPRCSTCSPSTASGSRTRATSRPRPSAGRCSSWRARSATSSIPAWPRSTWLAFTLETAEGSPAEVALPAGTRDAERARHRASSRDVFETTAELVARPELERAARPHDRAATRRRAATRGSSSPAPATNLVPRRPGRARRRRAARTTPAASAGTLRVVVAVEPHEADPAGGPPAHTVVTLDRPLGHARPVRQPVDGRAGALRRCARGPLCSATTRSPTTTCRCRCASASSTRHGRGDHRALRQQPRDLGRQALRGRANDALPRPALRRRHRRGAGCCSSSSAYEELYRVTTAIEEIHQRLPALRAVDARRRSPASTSSSSRRRPPSCGRGASGSSSPIRRARPRSRATEVPLDVAVGGLEQGRLVAIAGVDADSGEAVAEVRAVSAVVADGGRSTLVLDRALLHRYVPASVRVNANVAPATHGESWSETLGSGDARRPLPALPPRERAAHLHARGDALRRPEHADRARRRRRVGPGRDARRPAAGGAGLHRPPRRRRLGHGRVRPGVAAADRAAGTSPPPTGSASARRATSRRTRSRSRSAARSACAG